MDDSPLYHLLLARIITANTSNPAWTSSRSIPATSAFLPQVWDGSGVFFGYYLISSQSVLQMRIALSESQEIIQYSFTFCDTMITHFGEYLGTQIN